MRIARLIFGCLVYMLGAMSRVAVPGMVFERIIEDYGLTSAQVALLPSAGVFGCMLFIGLSGVFVDRFGWGRMLLVGSVLQALAYVPVHESSNLLLMLIGEFFNGGGRTIVYLAILKLFDVSFDRRYFAAMIGVFYVFSYGVTSVLLAGTKECVPTVYMASAIGFTNLFANVVQIGGNQVSGALMALGETGYPFVFVLYLVLAGVSLIAAVRFARS